MRQLALGFGALALALTAGTSVAVDQSLPVYRAMKIRAEDVLNGSILSSQVFPGSDKQLVALVTHMTGKRDEADAVNVRLEVFRRGAVDLESLYARDYGKENGGYVGRGELSALDLDGDGLHEIMVSYDFAKDRLVQDRRAEVLARDGSAFRIAWSGSIQYDATRAARGVPADRRDRFTRELDIPATLRTRGASLVFRKTTIAVAGERLAEPRVTVEAFPLR
jgi:hypothetical protein